MDSGKFRFALYAVDLGKDLVCQQCAFGTGLFFGCGDKRRDRLVYAIELKERPALCVPGL